MAGHILGVILSQTENSSDYLLQLWDWKTGKLLGKMSVDSKSFIFLAEDLFIVPSNSKWGFQFYHVAPSSSPSSSEKTIRPIGFLCFPRLSNPRIWGGQIDTWFQPIRLPPPTGTHLPTNTPLTSPNAPFSNDSSKTIICIRMGVEVSESWVYFPMIVHRIKLFEYARGFLSLYFHRIREYGQLTSEEGGQAEVGVEHVQWKDWGPSNTSIFGPERHWLRTVASVSGTRWLHVHYPRGHGGLTWYGTVIEILDFGVPKSRQCVSRMRSGQHPLVEDEDEKCKKEEEEESGFKEGGEEEDEKSEYTAHVKFLTSSERIDHFAFHKPIFTYLPCIQSTFLLKGSYMPGYSLSIQLGVRNDAWKRVRGGGGRNYRDKEGNGLDRRGKEKREKDWESFTGTLWDTEYLSAGCIAGAKASFSFVCC